MLRIGEFLRSGIIMKADGLSEMFCNVSCTEIQMVKRVLRQRKNLIGLLPVINAYLLLLSRPYQQI